MLVTDGEGGRRHRNALAHAGRGPLPIERDMRAANQRRPDEIRLRRLDLGDGRAEIGDVEREEVDRGYFAAVLGDVFLHPLRGDLPVIVVGGDDIDLLAPLLHGVRHELLDRLRRRYAGIELVAVADAAFILRVVEIQRLEAVEHRPDHLARGGGDAAMHDGNLVLQRRLLRELGIELHVRLRVVVDQLDLPSEQAAGRIGFLDRKRNRVDHRLAVDVETTREIVDAGHVDRVFRPGAGTERAGGGGCGRALQEPSAIDFHCRTPRCCRYVMRPDIFSRSTRPSCILDRPCFRAGCDRPD